MTDFDYDFDYNYNFDYDYDLNLTMTWLWLDQKTPEVLLPKGLRLEKGPSNLTTISNIVAWSTRSSVQACLSSSWLG